MASRKSSATAEKRFICTFNDCNRAFTRQEHLTRHSQNHLGGDFTCERCRAHFKRRDLLERHTTRHRQKDEEGGGALMTRKRSWKDANGAIVTKRPALGIEGSSSHGSASGFSEESPQLMSPPKSSDGAQPPIQEADNAVGLNSVQGAWTLINSDTAGAGLPDDSWHMNDILAAEPVRNEQDFRVYQTNDLFVDAFNPDTASSFNMPFTTMNNYNWLFDMNIPSTADFAMNAVEFAPPGPESQTGVMNDYFGVVDHAGVTGYTGVPMVRAEPQEVLVNNTLTQGHDRPISHTLPTPDSDSIIVSTKGRKSSSRSAMSTQATSISEGSEHSHGREHVQPQPSRLTDVERPMALLNPNTLFPRIDALARSQVMRLVETIRPMTPDGCYIGPDHPLLSLSALQTYSDLYFSRFNAAYPLIHQPTFEPSKVETLLLVSVLLLGATYCEKEAHQLAVCIHDVLRPQIFAHSNFSAQPKLWVLQTILLVECFGKSRAGQKQHDMSHLFHGLLINLIRRSDCQAIRPESAIEEGADLEDLWRAWVEAEQKKRLALLCFMWDTQHAVLFCQSLCMSAFELRSALPCDQFLWEAESAEKWQKVRQKQKPPPPFLTVLKSYLTSSAPTAARNLNALSRVLLLHGLMSIAWDMNRRDQTSLGLVGDNLVGDWRLRISEAYDTWKADFDAYIMSITQLHASPSSSTGITTNQQRREARNEFKIYSTVNAALYHAAHVILFSDFLDIQIYAGARHILGRQVGRVDYSRSQRVVKRWANEQSTISSKATWHAAHIIKDAVMNLEDFDAGGLFIHPWCLYLATITVWSFHHARPTVNRGTGVNLKDEDDDEMIWDTSADMHALISSMTRGTSEQLAQAVTNSKKPSTAGLTAVIANQLSKIRWAVVHDGMLVLKGLVPWRLINEADAL